ncbi:MAG: peptidase M20 [Alteromonadaceae bacterium]|nr:peptidase M20 [Alteromonadaceae bacterium]
MNLTLGKELQDRLVNALDEQEYIDLTTEMVAIGQPHSTNPLDPDIPAGEEEAIALFVAGKLEAMGFTVSRHYSQDRRPNIVGVLKGTGGGPSLMINDHLDTYPAVETHRWDKCDGQPFKATRHGDWIYGRGTSDTRANLAASLLAVKSVLNSGAKLKGDLICCYTVDEEKDGVHGSVFLTQTLGITADHSITVEPTAWGKDSDDWGLNLSVANSGHCLVRLVVRGIKSHIWRPDTGVNAITKAAELVPVLNAMPFRHTPSAFPGHTPPCACVVRVEGGLPGEMQFTPDSCTLTLAVVGILPGMTLDSVVGDISAVVAETLTGQEGTAFEVDQLPGSLFVKGTEPVPMDDEPNASLSLAYQSVLGTKPRPNRKNAFNDTIRFREAGMNAVTFGPGEDGWSPINECISIKKSVAAMKVLALAIPNILGVSE